MNSVTYKKASELKSKDQVILPGDVVRTVAGKFISGEKIMVTFVGGVERHFNHTDTMKVKVGSHNLGKKMPDYIEKSPYY